jgi:two-component system response regulator CiaR
MSAAEPRRPVVLLLDDEAQLTAVMVRMLEKEFEVEAAANVEEASLLLSTRRYDAIIADHMMPGEKQGLDFLVDAIRLQPTAKRILMTGYMNPELLARAVTLGQLSALLLKPATAQQIRKALHDALGLSV